ncbi:15-hydroxyprostaglandin dehydrogenase [NAD(+)] [Pseudocercospora fuligena]|uniref:15-hydroxyprostaglandin dehydrogenase [NAD(+)] n=1 Tax=Pseudocercospora fuligena TaxID=685502 RepID=A0A8H6R896_9PEZI|nr:15-hydroxyprostaglandin dehydrogenase [NAD(+)] [Pseudocercospora fuligena]
MFSTIAGNNLLYKGAALYATTTAFAAFWLTVRQPIQAGKEGPYNVHRPTYPMATSSKGTLMKSALITGGASGMGLEVAKALANRGDWHVHLLDLNVDRGNEAVTTIGNDKATFHETNVLDYDYLANTFQKVYDHSSRLDFVFANAGIVERFNFYESHPVGKPPPPPDQLVIDLNLKSVINTVWLSQHYFRQSTQSDDKNLIITASVGALYRCQVSPSYCASKHGVLGLMRSIAPHFYKYDGIRVNAICPASVKTNLLDSTAWNTFPDDVFVPIEKVVEACVLLIDGKDGENKLLEPKSGHESTNGATGGVTDGHKLFGHAVELSGLKMYDRKQPGYADAHLARCMKATERDTYLE